ncbi:MAG: molybdate ABC transporter substrate-binding protein [Campylobacterota bacterium]
MKKLLMTCAIAVFSYAGSINIAVAANVSYAVEDLIKEFNKRYPDTDVKVTLSSSGKLTAQIKNGAPYQLFMAANMDYPHALYDEGIAVTRPLVYAQGGISFLSSSKKDFDRGMEMVTDKNIGKIAIANPKAAPYGAASVEALKNARLYEEVKDKFVYAESISQTVSYAVTAADIGFIAKSSLYSDKMSRYKKGVHYADVDPKLYTPIDQGIVILKNAQANKEVAAFYSFVLSKKAKEVFENYGYLVP